MSSKKGQHRMQYRSAKLNYWERRGKSCQSNSDSQFDE